MMQEDGVSLLKDFSFKKNFISKVTGRFHGGKL